MILKKGQAVRVRAKNTTDEWCEGIVLVIGPARSPQAVGVALDGAVRARRGFLAGALPLYVGEIIEGLDGQEYEMEVEDL